MSKILLSLIILFSIIVSIFIKPLAVQAEAPNGYVGFGSVELEVPELYQEGDFQLDIETNAGNYLFDTRIDGRWCGSFRLRRGPCLPTQNLAAFNPSVSGSTTHIKIAAIRRFVNGQEDTGGKFSLIKNLQEYDLPNKGETGWITYKWLPEVEYPKIELDSHQITTSESISATITFPNPKAPLYNILLNPVNSGNPSRVDGQILISCQNNQCQIQRSDNLESVNYTNTTGQLSFKIKGSNLIEGVTYKLSVFFEAKPPNIDLSTTFLVTSSITPALTIIIDPISLKESETKNKSIKITLANGTTEQYQVVMPGKGAISFNCSGGGCFTQFPLGTDGVKAGPHEIKVTSINTPSFTGTIIFDVMPDAPAPTGRVGGGGGAGSGTTGPKTSAAGTSCDAFNGKTADTRDQNKFPKPEDFENYLKINPGNVGVYTAIGCIPTEPTALIKGLLKFAMGAGGGIALLLMIYGAFQMITSAGNPDGVKKGHEQITSAVMGLLFIIFAVMLLKVIGVDILQIPGFQ